LLARLFRASQPPLVISRLDVVVRESLDGDRFLLAQRFQPFGDPAMEPSPADRVQLPVENLSNLVVRERKLVASPGDEQLRSDRFVECIEQSVLAAVVGRGQLREIEGLAEHGRGPEHFIARGSHSIQSVPDRFLDALRDAHISRVAPLPFFGVAENRSLLDERFQNFFHEKWISVGLAVNERRELRADVLSEEGGKLSASLVGAETLERNPRGEPLAIPVDERFR